MNPTVAQFRSDFPEFADVSKYPDSMLTFWLTVATTLVNPARWATLATQGQELVASHFIVVSLRDRNAALAGGTPGQVVGLQTAKSTADLSVSYDYSSVLVEGAGFWNSTSYGQRYLTLARLFGAGGIQF